MKQKDVVTTRIASLLDSMIYRENQRTSICEEKIGKKTWWKYLTRALTKYGSVNSAGKYEEHSQTT